MVEITVDQIKTLVSSDWPRYAALAWGGFKERGRGSLMMLILEPDRIEVGDFDSTTLYTDLQDMKDKAEGKKLSSVEKLQFSQMEEYDPKTQLVISAINPATQHMVTFVIGNHVETPPKMYEQNKEAVSVMGLKDRLGTLEALKKHRPNPTSQS